MTRRLPLLSLFSLFFFFLFSLGLGAQTRDNYLSTLRDKNVKIDGGNLPIVFINVEGRMIQKNSHVLAYMKIVDNGPGALNYSDTISHPGQTVDYEGWVGLKYRGNSSFTQSDKKPYAVQTLAANVLTENGGEKQKVKILGMGKDHKWAMLAPWCDRSMLRDALAFELGRPWFDYVPHTRFCEVILDGTYYGVYVFTERVSKGKKRLNLNDPGSDEGDLSGDYLVEVDRADEACYTSPFHPWSSLRGSENPWKQVKYQYKSPEDEDFAALPEGTRQALHAEINKMEQSFYTAKWQDPVEGYRKYIDDTSFIDYLLATELAMNIDGYRLSTNLYKYSDTRARNEGLDPRWKMSLWDFNIAYGNANYYHGEDTDTWQYLFNEREPSDGEHVPFYWYKMLMDNQFVSDMKARWQAYRDSNCSDERLFATVDSLAARLTDGGAVERNQQAWRILDRWGVWPCPYVPYTYDEEIAHLKDWLRKRVVFMDRELLDREPTPDPPQTVVLSQPYAIADGLGEDIFAEQTPAATYTSCAVDAVNVFYTSEARESGGMASTSVTAAGSGVRFALAGFDCPNAACLADGPATLTLAEPAATSHLYILGTSANGASDVRATIRYTDGSTSTASLFTLPDWSVRNPSGTEAVTRLGRLSRDGDSFAADPHYCLFDVAVSADGQKQIAAVSFNLVSGGRPFILALSGDKLMTQATLIPDMAEDGTNPGEDYTKLFDLDVSTKWGFDWRGQPVSVVFHSTEPITVETYTVITANDNATYPGRNPKAWTLYGSTAESCPDYDDESWEPIHQVADSGMEDKNFEPYNFAPASASDRPYRYFKWTITERQSQSGWGRYTQMSEFQIKGVLAPASSVAPPVAQPRQPSGTYNLQGQRVGPAYHGVVIENGKKRIQ